MKIYSNYLFFFLILIFSSLLFGQKNDLNKKLIELKNSQALKHGQWGVYAEYVDNGEKIISLDEEESLAPASGLKVFTTITALNYLGENYKFKTKLYYDGKINPDGNLDGNIYIVGCGDPTLGSDLVKTSPPLDSLMKLWTFAVMQKGIKKVNGSIIADNLLFDNQTVPDYWPYIDIGNYYGAGPNALTINNNLYYLYFKPSKNVGDEAKVLRTEPEISGLNFINYVKTGPVGSGDNGYIYDSPEKFKAVLRGTIPAGVDEFYIKGSIPDPALFAAQYFTSFLKENNIEILGEAKKLKEKKIYDDSKIITKTISPPVKNIVFIINKKSFNLYAEQLLKTAALEKTGEGSTQKGTEIISSFLDSIGISTEGLNLFDGSGLSRTNMITAKMMVKLLSFVSWQKYFTAFYNSLSVAGDPDDFGNFKNYGRNTLIEKNARIKSGLITGVRSHSGYLKNKSGRLIAFSFIANNFSGRTSEINNIHKQLMILLAGTK